MHRRLLIVDGEMGFAGGVGIADVWTGDAQDPEHWRETHLRVEGPAVRDILAGFAENWTEATGRILAGHRLAELAPLSDGCDLQVVRSSPTTAGTPTAPLFYAAIAGAQKRLWLYMDASLAADALGVGLLVADIVLPVPSSVVMVAHGACSGSGWGRCSPWSPLWETPPWAWP